jgi:hypothetical protein
MKLFRPNGPLYKVMWAADGSNIIWNMQQESHDIDCANLAHQLAQYIDVGAWVHSYEEHYRQWLEQDDSTIFTINSPLLVSMLNAVQSFNKEEESKLYYWFDVNRLATPAVQWRYSPLSGEKLFQLPASFSFVNRYIAPTDFLVFPSVAL